jgi:penicillin-binding protein 2
MLIFDQLNKADRHLRALSWVVAIGVVILLSGLWWVQVVRSRHYVEDQRNQSYRTVRVPAPRGKILDRNGVALAENRPVYNVSLYLDDRGWRDLVKKEYAREVETARANSVAPPRKLSWSEKMAGFLGRRKPGAELRRLTAAEKNVLARRSRYVVTSNLVQQLSVALELPLVVNEAKFHEHYEQRRALPMSIISDLNSSRIARFQEQGMHLPGLDMEIQPMRIYPQGTLAAHVLGYLKRSEESSEDELSFYNYRLPDYRGQSAVEYSFDEELRGKAGSKSVLVNNLGYRQSETVWSAVEAGKNVTLTIDAEIQRVAETELGKATAKPVRGAVVVLDTRTGEIIAMASAPTFDPNSWIPRLPQAVFDTYTNKEVAPLLNRAVYTGFPPGSTFKTVVALAALEARALNPEDIYHSLGYYPLGKGIKDTAVAGDYNFKRAFKKSSNSYFIEYGLRMGPEAIVAMAERLHFSERTGIPLGQDSPGNVPTRERVKKRAWRDGDTANICIGQGEVLVTPLQMAIATAAVANGGKVLWPQLVASVQAADAIIDLSARSSFQARVRDRLPVSNRTLEVIREAMLADTEDPLPDKGTAFDAFHEHDQKTPILKNFRVGGKTGTAQLERGGRVYDHITWFASYGPAEPRYAVVVMVQSGSSGGGTCAPIAAKIYQALQYREQQAPATRRNIFANN